MGTVEIEHKTTAQKEDCPVLRQVCFDLKRYLAQFPNERFAIRIVSEETGLNQKTLRRLMLGENRPTHQTLLKLYSLFYQLDDYQQVYAMAPEVIRQRIADYNPDEDVLGKRKKDKNTLLELLKSEPLASEILILAGLMPLQKSIISFRYGEFGVKVMQSLFKEGFLIEQQKDQFTLSALGPELDAECLKTLGLHFTRRFSKPSQAKVLNQNILSFYAESLNEEGKEQWLKIDTEAFYKKVEIAKSPQFKGHLPVYTFTTTDTISTESPS
jgi:hypothetical protein